MTDTNDLTSKDSADVVHSASQISLAGATETKSTTKSNTHSIVPSRVQSTSRLDSTIQTALATSSRPVSKPSSVHGSRVALTVHKSKPASLSSLSREVTGSFPLMAVAGASRRDSATVHSKRASLADLLARSLHESRAASKKDLTATDGSRPASKQGSKPASKLGSKSASVYTSAKELQEAEPGSVSAHEIQPSEKDPGQILSEASSVGNGMDANVESEPKSVEHNVEAAIFEGKSEVGATNAVELIQENEANNSEMTTSGAEQEVKRPTVPASQMTLRQSSQPSISVSPLRSVRSSKANLSGSSHISSNVQASSSKADLVATKSVNSMGPETMSTENVGEKSIPSEPKSRSSAQLSSATSTGRKNNVSVKPTGKKMSRAASIQLMDKWADFGVPDPKEKVSSVTVELLKSLRTSATNLVTNAARPSGGEEAVVSEENEIRGHATHNHAEQNVSQENDSRIADENPANMNLYAEEIAVEGLAQKKAMQNSHNQDAASVPVSHERTKSGANYVNIISSLRKEITLLRQEIGIRDEAIDGLKDKEADLLKTLEHSPELGYENKNTRISLDRQKKAYQILVAKLRREIRRLKFQRNSTSDPLVEAKYFPYLPRTAFSTNPRTPPIGIIGNLPQRSSDYFALNPPPPTGNHLDSGTRWWWGSGPNLAGHLPNSMPAPKPRNHTAVNPTPYLAELAAKPPAVPTAIQQALPPLNVKDTVASTQPEESKVGDRVCVVINGGRVLGMVKYVGMFDPHPSSGLWCGIKLDRPLGTHDGVVRGKRYFKCEENHGLFVKIDKIISVGHAHGQRIATVTHGSLLV